MEQEGPSMQRFILYLDPIASRLDFDDREEFAHHFIDHTMGEIGEMSGMEEPDIQLSDDHSTGILINDPPMEALKNEILSWGRPNPMEVLKNKIRSWGRPEIHDGIVWFTMDEQKAPIKK